MLINRSCMYGVFSPIFILVWRGVRHFIALSFKDIDKVFVFIVGLVVYIIIIFMNYRITPSKGCGPFRIYSDMSVSVDTTISNFPDGLKTAIDILTSTSMIVSILTILWWVQPKKICISLSIACNLHKYLKLSL